MVKAGLPKLNIMTKTTTTSSFKSTASTNLTGAKRTAGASYGIGAQRSNMMILNSRMSNSNYISNVRHELLNTRGAVTNNYYKGKNSGNTTSNPYADVMKMQQEMMKWQMVSEGITGAISGIKDIADVFKSSGTSSSENNIGKLNSTNVSNTSKTGKSTGVDAMQGGKTTSAGSAKATLSSTKSAINSMKNATDSTTLREAIENATEEYNKISEALPGLKTAAEQAKTQLQQLESSIPKKEQDVSTAKDKVSKATTARDAAQAARDSAEQNMNSMNETVGEAATNYTKESDILTDLKCQLATTKETIIDESGNTVPNPAYKDLQDQIQKQESKQQDALNKLKEAKDNLKTAKEDFDKKVEYLAKKNQELENEKVKLENAQKELETANKELDELKQQKQDAEDTVNEYTNKEKDKNTLKQEIDTQTKRLQDLQTSESKDLDSTKKKMSKLSGKIDNRNDKIKTEDGLNFFEKMKLKRNKKNAQKYGNLASTRDDLQTKSNYTKLYSDQSAVKGYAGGKALKSASYNGETYYMIGAKPVDQKTFDAALNKSKEIEKQNGDME